MQKQILISIFIIFTCVFNSSCSDTSVRKSMDVDTYICSFKIEGLKEIGDKSLDIITEVMDLSGVIKVNEDVPMNTVFVIYNHNEINATLIESKIEEVNNAVYNASLIADDPVDIRPFEEGLDSDNEGASV